MPPSDRSCCPRATLFVFRHAGVEFAVRSILGSLQTHGRYQPFSWPFGARVGERMIEGEIFTEPADVIGLTYTDTDGGVEVLLQLGDRHVPNPVGGKGI